MEKLTQISVSMLIGALIMVTPPILQATAKYMPSQCDAGFNKMLSDTANHMNNLPPSLKYRG